MYSEFGGSLNAHLLVLELVLPLSDISSIKNSRPRPKECGYFCIN